MKLSELIKAAGMFTEFLNCEPESLPDREISSIHYDSRTVKPGGLFVAIKGLVSDGHDYIDDAFSKGAAAVVAGEKVGAKGPVITAKDTRKALSELAAVFYGRPSEGMTLIGITGTNGKTTTVSIVESILQAAGCSTGVIGTIDCHYGGRRYPNPVTTPESLDLQKILKDMKDGGVTHVIMEVSSHAIDLDRIFSCDFDVKAFTNLSQDHLDYHEDMNGYWACKKRFFLESYSRTPSGGKTGTVINCNDPRGETLLNELINSGKDRGLLSVGDSIDFIIQPGSPRFDLSGIRGTITTPNETFAFKTSLAGKHNLENILVATGICVALDIPCDYIKKGLETFKNVPGRLERIDNENGKFVFVDYAHTPDALLNVLSTIKSITDGRIICVFGCGGDRDRSKRPKMGKISGQTADLSVITSDNPRTEDPDRIIEEILAGIEELNLRRYSPEELANGFDENGCTVEPDRASAIKTGIEAAGSGDAVIIAGKGHEDYQIIGTEKIFFDDRVTAREVLSKNAG